MGKINLSVSMRPSNHVQILKVLSEKILVKCQKLTILKNVEVAQA
jgi:hypothetical protein